MLKRSLREWLWANELTTTETAWKYRSAVLFVHTWNSVGICAVWFWGVHLVPWRGGSIWWGRVRSLKSPRSVRLPRWSDRTTRRSRSSWTGMQLERGERDWARGEWALGLILGWQTVKTWLMWGRRKRKERLTEEREHEDAVVSYPQLVWIFKILSGHKILILWSKKQEQKQV